MTDKNWIGLSFLPGCRFDWPQTNLESLRLRTYTTAITTLCWRNQQKFQCVASSVSPRQVSSICARTTYDMSHAFVNSDEVIKMLKAFSMRDTKAAQARLQRKFFTLSTRKLIEEAFHAHLWTIQSQLFVGVQRIPHWNRMRMCAGSVTRWVDEWGGYGGDIESRKIDWIVESF